MKQKRILLTGAAGFIGFHTALYLKRRGDFVLGFDNFNDYYDPLLKHSRASQLALEGIDIIKEDICNEDALQAAVRDHNITHLVHLAAQAGVRYSLKNPHAYLEANIKGFLNILEVCRTNPGIPLIYASSSSVYGLNDTAPFSIRDRTDRQASFYGVTKKTNELMAQTYHHLYGINVTGLRFFTVYGPWGRPDMAYFMFARAIIENQPIEIYNHGHMKRDFTYIDDIVFGIGAAVDRSYPHEIFNLGHHHPEELSTLIALLEDGLNRKAHKIFLPHQPGDVVATFADITESTEKLGFIPKVTLEEGIGQFISWFRDFFRLK